MKPDTLNDFYSTLKNGCSVEDFLSFMKNNFDTYVPDQDKPAYSKATEKFKKLHDEIVPMEIFLKENGKNYSKIIMPLDDSFPDATITDANGVTKNVEITTANKREAVNIAWELTKNRGPVPGFLGVTDDKPQQEFDRKINDREAVETQVIQKHLLDGVELSLKKKANHTVDILLIYYEKFKALRRERWYEITSKLKKLAQNKNQGEIYLIGEIPSQPDIVLKIK